MMVTKTYISKFLRNNNELIRIGVHLLMKYKVFSIGKVIQEGMKVNFISPLFIRLKKGLM